MPTAKVTLPKPILFVIARIVPGSEFANRTTPAKFEFQRLDLRSNNSLQFVKDINSASQYTLLQAIQEIASWEKIEKDALRKRPDSTVFFYSIIPVR